PRRTKLALATVPDSGELTLQIEIRLEKGYKLNSEAKMAYLVETLPGAKTAWSETKRLAEGKTKFNLVVPVDKLAGSSGLQLSLVYYECGEDSEAICRV